MALYRSGRIFGYTYVIQGETEADVKLVIYRDNNEIIYEHITRTEAFKKIQKIYDFEMGVYL